LGDNLYRIDNVPFFTALVSYGDVVVGEQLEDAGPGFMRFVRVHSRGGHSTIWVSTNEGKEAQESAEFLFDLFKERGCGTERSSSIGTVAIDLPPMTGKQLDIVSGIINGAVDEGIWTYSAGYIAPASDENSEA
jgi:Domain of unknown function (DUF4265)